MVFKTHPRQWVDRSDPFNNGRSVIINTNGRRGVACLVGGLMVFKTYPRQWVDRSDPFYKRTLRNNKYHQRQLVDRSDLL